MKLSQLLVVSVIGIFLGACSTMPASGPSASAINSISNSELGVDGNNILVLDLNSDISTRMNYIYEKSLLTDLP